MPKRQRSSSSPKLNQGHIFRAEKIDYNNSNSSSNSDKRETKKLGISSFYSHLRNRETGISTNKPYTDTIEFPFNGKSGTLNLKRFFINGKEEDLFDKSKNIHIYNIYIEDNKLFFAEYINISKDYYQGQQEKEYALFDSQNGEVISHDIKGTIIYKNGREMYDEQSVICDNIDFNNYLFIDDKKQNYYYINYDLNKEIFNLFKSIYNRKLNLKLYNGKKLTSIENYELFKENDEDEYIRQLQKEEEKRRLEEQEEEKRKEGGTSKKTYKKILKSYLKV